MKMYKKIIKVTADLLKINLQKSDILSVRRVKSKDSNDTKIIVIFNSNVTKESFISEIKSRIINKQSFK